MRINIIMLWVILAAAIVIFKAGFFYRISIWLEGSKGSGTEKPQSKLTRFFNYSALLCKNVFSRNFKSTVKSFFLDGIIHVNLLKDNLLKWLIHIFMFWGLSLFTLLSTLHLIAIASAPGGLALESSCWFVNVFGTLENRFMLLAMDLARLAIPGGALLAVIRFLFLKKKLKSVELKDKSAGVIISIITVLSFIYSAAFILAESIPAQRAAFGPVSFIISRILSFIPAGPNLWAIIAVVFFYIYIITIFLFVSLIPYGRYSHMVFGPVIVVYSKLKQKS
ncbi:MAG: hypothetical protein FJW68_10050 [Actinobacteria bacterium]|nr:hypothetical protein [Actinomycetota bacterium]